MRHPRLASLVCVSILALAATHDRAPAVDRETFGRGGRPASEAWSALGDPVPVFFPGLDPDRRPGVIRWLRAGPRTRLGLGAGVSVDRVDGLALLASQELATAGWGPSIRLYQGYGFSSEEWSAGVETRVRPGAGPIQLGFRWADETREAPLPRSAILVTENLLAAAFARRDFRDYLRREGRTYFIQWSPQRGGTLPARSGVVVSFHDERHESRARNIARFGWFGGDRRFPDNPPVEEGAWNLLQLRASWSPDPTPSVWGASLTPSSLLEVTWAGGALGDGRVFTRVWAEHRGVSELGGHQTLAYRLAAGATPQGSEDTDGSRLPPQWRFRAGGVGTLRGHPFHEFQGDRIALASLEYRREWGAPIRPVLFVDAGKAWNESDDLSGGLAGSGPLALDGGVGLLLGADGLRLDLARDLRQERAPARLTVRVFHPL